MNEGIAAKPTLAELRNRQAWRGPELQAGTDWIHEFTPSEISEIDAAVARVSNASLDILDIKVGDFPLPTLGPVLSQAREEILQGRGFHLFRNVPVERYGLHGSAIAFWGLGLHFGQPLSQNGKGHVLGHVANLGLDYADPETRGYQTKARLPYHTDAGDVVGLMCLRTSRTGGASSIVSSTTVWNELVARRPDHASTLMEPLFYTRWGEIPEGKKPYEPIPIFSPCAGRMIATYVRSAITKAQALPGVPALTKQQFEAMDFLDALMADPELHLDMEFRPGDLQLANNYSIFHSRTAYEDWPETTRRRHLLRLWLACDDGPALPPFMYERYGTTAAGRPDGIRVPGVPLVAPLEAA
jgi:hypothetical protein